MSTMFSANQTDYIEKLNLLADGLLVIDLSQTVNFNAVASSWYVLNNNALTATLPVSPVALQRLRFSFRGSVGLLTLGRNGNKIMNLAADYTLSGQAGSDWDLVYVDATYGWLVLAGGAGNTAFEVKSGAFTAEKFKQYVLASGAVPTLPATPTAGDWVRLAGADYNLSGFAVGRNSSKIESASADYTIGVYAFDIWFVYIDSTIGWKMYFNRRDQMKAPTISSGTLTLDLERGKVNGFNVALNANITTLTINNAPVTGDLWGFEIIFTADGTPRTIAWGSGRNFSNSNIAPTPTSTNTKVDRYWFETKDGGTTWWITILGQAW